jgi:type IV secretion system protein VirB10
MSTEQNPTEVSYVTQPPNPRRLSRRAGIAAALVFVALIGSIMYGMITRQENSRRVAAEKESGATPAVNAARDIIQGIGEGNMAEPPPGRELRDPAPRVAEAPPALDVAPAVEAPPTRTEMTPEERLREEAFQRHRAAIMASTKVDSDGMRPGQAAGGLQGVPGALPPAFAGVNLGQGQGASPSSAGATAALLKAAGLEGEADGYRSQNDQKGKIAFNNAQQAVDGNYLKASRNPALSPYEVKAGWDIPAVLDQGVNSDLPGEIHAVIRENVYDTATGRFLLIPKGSRALGIYNSSVSFGQERVQVVWNRIIFPDASSMDLGNMIGQDAGGYAGFKDQVNNHWGRIIGAALLSTVFSVGFEISQRGKRNNDSNYPSAADVAGAAAGAEISRAGSRVVQRSLDIQPTLEIRPGYRFNIRVNKDMLFSEPYREMLPLTR